MTSWFVNFSSGLDSEESKKAARSSGWYIWVLQVVTDKKTATQGVKIWAM